MPPRVKTLASWGYKTGTTYDVKTLKIHYRPGTTDEKVIQEVLLDNVYQNRRNAQCAVERTDCWLDLGANIGTFSLLVRSLGARVVSVEPEPTNVALLKTNLAANFPPRHQLVVAAGVAARRGTAQLYLANGAHNKYRHSMYMTKGRGTALTVPVRGLGDLLRTRVDGVPVNAVKLDIEGMEIPLLEAYADKFGPHVRKVVFEYTFDADPSIPRFLEITKRLRRHFDVVHHRYIDPKAKEYKFFPPAVTVWCTRK